MKKTLLIICIFLFGFRGNELPFGWTQIEKTKIGKEKFDVFFFDYMSKLSSIRPDYEQYKGRAFTEILHDVQFKYPVYVAKGKVDKQDSIILFILRPNENKADRPFYFDLQIAKVGKEFSLSSLQNIETYKDRILKTMDANGCRGSLLAEYNTVIQQNPDKQNLIGNGIQITDSIYTRIIPYEEVKKPFYKLIESNL